MKRLLAAIFIAYMLSGCDYASRVTSLSDDELCENLGAYTLKNHEEGLGVTYGEIEKRDIDAESCVAIANREIKNQIPGYKLELCQGIAKYHYNGAYAHFKDALEKIQNAGFADDECDTMAQFMMTRIARSKERNAAIANAIAQTTILMQERNRQLYGIGSSSNPLYIKVY